MIKELECENNAELTWDSVKEESSIEDSVQHLHE